MLETPTIGLAARVLEKLRGRGETLVVAESCTGGLLAGALTSISGSSDVVWGGYVSYANGAKTAMIGVAPSLLAPDGPGAVSEEVARAMAEGALKAARAAEPKVAVAVAITGVAGPTGSEKKPVGLVHFAVATPAGTRHVEKRYGSLDRATIRELSVRQALEMLLEG
ncbi:MAG: nicotinamide-nucleotide amidohydrolase family protein [Cucumibacter sp.]